MKISELHFALRINEMAKRGMGNFFHSRVRVADGLRAADEPAQGETTMTIKNENEAIRKMAVVSAVQWMDQLIAGQEDGIRTLKQQRQAFVDACKNREPRSLATPVNVLGWFINDVNNMRMQGRLDLAVNHAAALALTSKKD